MEDLRSLFQQKFLAPCQVLAAAPGRVNLIGEHTDYSGGFVLPMALDKEVHVAVRRREDRRLRLYSAGHGQELDLDLDALAFRPENSWGNYIAGTLWALREAGHPIYGMDLLVKGDLPQGAGLSSSAALELAVARAACALGGWAWDAPAMALLAQKAENKFVGVNCGIMDQFAVAVAEPQCALFLDCRSLAYRSVPIRFPQAGFVVVNSGVSRELKGSAYNDRRRECEEAVQRLAAVRPGLASLRDADLGLLASVGGSSDLWFKRARHVVSENARVEAAVAAIEAVEPAKLGALMTQSHFSLRDDFEVSCPELDLLVDTALKLPGVMGSRLTGAGFGGCTVSLVERAQTETFGKELARIYKQGTGIEAQVYTFLPGQAARVL
jgi:galactokinase